MGNWVRPQDLLLPKQVAVGVRAALKLRPPAMLRRPPRSVLDQVPLEAFQQAYADDLEYRNQQIDRGFARALQETHRRDDAATQHEGPAPDAGVGPS